MPDWWPMVLDQDCIWKWCWLNSQAASYDTWPFPQCANTILHQEHSVTQKCNVEQIFGQTKFMMNPSLEEVFFARLGSSAKTAKKIPFSSTFPPNREGNTFSEKYICQICSSPCPQGRQQSTAVAADPQSPHPLPPSPPPLLPRLASTQSCLCLLPATTQKFWPQSLRALWLLSGPDSHAKGRFPGIYASNVSCWHHSAGTH